MPSSCWTIDHRQARLQYGPLSARINLSDCVPAVVDIVYRGQPLAGDQLLGIDLGIAPAISPEAADPYVRGQDLVATWLPRPDHRVQVYWRCGGLADAADAVTVDLQVSVQTDQLDSDASQHATGVLSEAEVYRLGDAAAGRFARMEVRPVSHLLRPAEGPGCLLFRPAGASFSYAEMIHPSDFTGDRINTTRRTTLDHQLFAMRLEKGVIVRARVRGAWMPRRGDEQLAAAIYRQFEGAELPLTT